MIVTARITRCHVRVANLVLVAGAFLQGCSSAPEVDLGAVWVGTFSVEGGGSGTIGIDLRQQTDGTVTGGLGLVLDNLENQGVSLTGTVSGHHASLKTGSTDDEIELDEDAGVLEGTIDGGSTRATFRVTRLQTGAARFDEAVPALGSAPRLLAFQGGHLWFFDWGQRELVERGDSGEEIAHLALPIDLNCETGFDGCGANLVCSGSGINLIDPATGTVTSSLEAKALGAGSGVSCGAGSLWGAAPRQALRFDLAGEVIASKPLPLLAREITFDGEGLWVLLTGLGALLRLDGQTLDVRAAYQLPEVSTDVSLGGLTWDGSALWTLRTNMAASTTEAVKLAVEEP